MQFILSMMLFLNGGSNCEGNLVYGSGFVGEYKIGDQTTNIIKGKKKYTHKLIFEEGDPYHVYSIKGCRNSIVNASTFKDGTIIELTTISSLYKTDKGARVGYTVEQLQKIYPLGRIYIGNEAGPYASFSHERMTFELDRSNIPSHCYQSKAKCNIKKIRASKFITR
jgi:hypothetical protein